MKTKSILVTGGAGYIGSHIVLKLLSRGYKVTVLDNLYSGHKWAIPKEAIFYEGSVGDQLLVEKIIEAEKIDAIIHMAAHIEVEESVSHPLKYYKNNTLNTLLLIESCLNKKIGNFIFSSTAAVYGLCEKLPIDEECPLLPINPYGHSKRMSEQIIRDASFSAPNFNFVILRYFNVAGASPAGKIGQATPRATHLIKVCCEASLGKRENVAVYGTDYPTKDGTGVRDYIHVDDLADAHLLSLEHLLKGGASDTFNCGYGRGYSVLEIIEMVKKVSGVNFSVKISGRRSGDAAALYSNPSKIKSTLGWNPQYDELEFICKTAYEWEKHYSHSRESGDDNLHARNS